MITVWIDELTPCLKDNVTGQLINTEVIRIRRKSVLKAYNRKSGWYESWSKLYDQNEVYALVIEGTYDIQGLIAVRMVNNDALYVAWMVANPESNPLLTDSKRYDGIGGHLFAIASRLSREKGCNGNIYGFASTKKLLEHYINTFNAEHLGILHNYHFMIDELNTRKIEEVYTYEFKGEEI